jgi:amino acid transporter
VAAEVRHPERNIFRALVLGILAVSVIYLAITLAFIWALGIGGLANSEAVAAQVLEIRIGPLAGTAISLLVIVSCLGSMNGTIFTGARVYYALGTHHPGFRWLGIWDENKGIPLRSLIVQAVATLGLTLSVGVFPGGFERLVTFTTPFFFGFTALVGLAMFFLRGRQEAVVTPYRAPLFPLTPVLFILSSLLMVYASVDYACRNPAWEALWAAGVVALGVFAGFVDWRQRTISTPLFR